MAQKARIPQSGQAKRQAGSTKLNGKKVFLILERVVIFAGHANNLGANIIIIIMKLIIKDTISILS